jgi:hypothetical protein
MDLLEFLLVFHSDHSTTAVLRADTIQEARRQAAKIAANDARLIELWRSQKLIAKFNLGEDHESEMAKGRTEFRSRE